MVLKRFMLTVIFSVLLLPALASAGEHQRDTWYIGFGLGTGDGSWTVNGDEVTFDDWMSGLDAGPKVALNFKVGKTLNSKNLLGFDITALGQSGTYYGIEEAHIQINNYFLMWTHFPQEEGLFFRLGGGPSIIVAEVNNVSGSESGIGVLGGVGYAFWLGDAFNLTVNLDHSRQSYGEDVDSSQFTILYLGFDWY